MNQTKQTEVLMKIGKKVKPHLVKVELIVLTFFIISMILKQSSENNPVGVLLMIGALFLAFLYFILAFSYAGGEKFERTFSFISYWSISIAVIGIMFVMESLPGGFIQVQVGALSSLFVLFAGFAFKKKFSLEKVMTKQMIIRLLLVGMIAGFMNFAPAETLRSVKIVPYEDFYSGEQSNDSLPETKQIVAEEER